MDTGAAGGFVGDRTERSDRRGRGPMVMTSQLTRRGLGRLLAGVSASGLFAQTGDGTGPAVGERIPDFAALDQYGKRRTFADLVGPNGLLLLFHRSADWCPFCKGQLVQLERKRDQFEREGVRLAAVSFDAVEVLKHFSQRAGIGFPLLADPAAEVIRRFGVLSKSVPADHQYYGIPNPGELLIGPDGVVRAKYFEEDLRDGFTGGRILVTELGGAGDGRTVIETEHLRATTWTSDAIVRGGNRVALGVDIELKPRMHVYAPGVEGYISLDWSMSDSAGVRVLPVRYPAPLRLEMPAIRETVPVYEGSFRLLRDVRIGQPKEIAALLDAQSRLKLGGQLRYQACDDKVCYLPRTLELSWSLAFEQHDVTRAPESVRRR